MTDDVIVNDGEDLSTDSLDTPTGDTIVEDSHAPAPAPVAPQIDFAALYRESLQERNRLAAEAEALRAARNAPQPEEELTDADIEKYGTTGTIKKIVASTLRTELQQSLGDIGMLSAEWKRGKQIETAEQQFFQQFPQIANVRNELSAIVRQALQNAPNVDANTYSQAALSAIGLYNIQQMTQQANTPAAPSNVPAPSRPSAPAPRTNGSPAPTAPRLTELERKAMRTAGFDPNKREDYDKFMAIVNNEDGVTVA